MTLFLSRRPGISQENDWMALAYNNSRKLSPESPTYPKSYRHKCLTFYPGCSQSLTYQGVTCEPHSLAYASFEGFVQAFLRRHLSPSPSVGAGRGGDPTGANHHCSPSVPFLSTLSGKRQLHASQDLWRSQACNFLCEVGAADNAFIFDWAV